MDEKLQELLNELAKELGGNVSVNTSQQETNQTVQQVAEQFQYEEPETNEVDYNNDYQIQLAWENWKQYGRTAFINSRQGDPRILKYMPLIEQRAEYKLQMDLTQNQMKDTYFHYLQEAYNEILVELAGIVKDFLPSRQVPYGYMGTPNLQETPVYTMKDYRNDYKKALEYATYKGMGQIYYKDSSEKGKYGEGKLRLGESLDELNI
jgi:hypothetical protein